MDSLLGLRFDPSQCNLADNPSPTAGLPTCPQGISAVKAIAIGAQAGQKIYTITPRCMHAIPISSVNN